MSKTTGSILIMDDDSTQRALLRELIQSNFPEVHVGEADGFDSAFQQAAAHEFDLFIMDLNLDGHSNGIETAKILKAMNGYHITPFIFISAADDLKQRLKDEFGDYGSFVSYHKPLKPQVFNRRVGRFLELMESLNQTRQTLRGLELLETEIIAADELLGGLNARRA